MSPASESEPGPRGEEPRLDPANACLRRGAQEQRLRPKAFALLSYLNANPGRIVTKDELLDAVWPEAIVGDAVLKVCIGELREALGDSAKAPTYIETAHRRGYRFLRPLAIVSDVETPLSVSPGPPGSPGPSSSAQATEPARSTLVGRASELAQLSESLAAVRNGQRRIVFVTGGMGVGKTSLVETFLEPLRSAPNTLIAHGQCQEFFGAAEAYLPILEAFSRLCRQEPARESVDVLRRHAPTWLVQLPSLVEPHEREELRTETLGATPERMLREMADAIEALTREHTLVLWLEDLHWSDAATLDLLATLARRRDPARFLLLATFRPVELILHDHDLRRLKRELELHQLSSELTLELLDRRAVDRFLEQRFGENTSAAELAPLGDWIWQRTDGHPLFLTHLMDFLLERSLIERRGSHWQVPAVTDELEELVPESLRRVLEGQIDLRGEDERELLEGASVAGSEFSSTSLAAILERPQIEIEERCRRLVQASAFLSFAGTMELPEGTLAERFRFRHTLYLDVLRRRVPTARRSQYHLRCAQRGARAYADQSDEIARELAEHFAQGRDFASAVRFLRRAARVSVRRFAHREARLSLQQALGWADRLAGESADEARLAILEELGILERGCGQMEAAAEAFAERARLAAKTGNAEEQARALLYEASASSWLDRERCIATVERVVALAREVDSTALRAHIRGGAGYWHLVWIGWRSEDAEACSQAIELAKNEKQRGLEALHTVRSSLFECLRGEYEQAAELARRGSDLSRAVSDFFDDLLGRFFEAWSLLFCGRWGAMQRVLDRALERAEVNGHELWATLFRLELAWLHQEARNYARAEELACESLKRARELENPYGERLGVILEARARLGQERCEEALELPGAIDAKRRILMDWILSMPVAYARGRGHRVREDWDALELEARGLLETASSCHEPTFEALAHRDLAEVAHARSDTKAATQAMASALDIVESREAPLAAWRVHAAAARLEPSARKASAQRRKAGRVWSAILETLPEDSELAQSITKDRWVAELRE